MRVHRKVGKRAKRWSVGALAMACLLQAGIGFGAGGGYAAAAAAGAPFDGAPAAWNSVGHDAVAAGNDLTQLKALQRDGKLYLYAKGAGLSAGGTFSIDSDNDPATGAASGLWADSGGIDYELRGDEWFRYEDGEWTDAGAAEVRFGETFVEAEVDLAAIGVAGSHYVKVGFQRDGAHALPDIGSLLMTVAPSAPVYGSGIAIDVDGDAADWAEVAPLAESADGSTTLKAFVGANRLNVLIQGRIDSGEFADGLWEHILIDTDKNPATGAVSWAWASKLGSEFLVQNGLLYASGGDGGWSWNDTGKTFPYERAGEGADKIIEWSVPLADLGIEETTTIRLGFLSNTRTAPDAAGDPATLAAVVEPQIAVDGDPSDWAGVDVLAESAGGATKLKAFAADGRLNALLEGQIDTNEFADGLWEHILIDTDKNPTTGAASWAWASKLGSEYLVQNGLLYASGADRGWSWNDTGKTFEYARAGSGSAKTIEWSVPLADLGLEDAASIRLGFLSNTETAPNASGDPATLQLAGGGEPIVIDGDDADWAGVELGAAPSGATTELYAVQDDRRLYTLVKGANLDLRNVYYIDSDRNAATGETSGIWQNAGADFKVDRGTLYRFDAGGWTKVGPVYTNVTSETAEMSLYLDQIGLAGPAAVGIGYESRSALQLPKAGEPMLAASATIERAAEADSFYPRESFDVLNNPYMGWAPWALDKDKPAGEPYDQPHSLVYAGISWRELEPERGEFDWAGIESKYQFDYWASLGKKIDLRIVLDTPTADPAHKDIPDWLYDELSEEGSPGTWYDTVEVGSGFSPNYNSETMLAEHGRMIAAVAARYDGDPRIGFVQLGSLGHWGEWHTWPAGSGVFPNLKQSDRYVQQYIDAFENKKLGMRKPFPIASEHHFGLFNDVFGIKSSTNEFIGWTNNGWTGIGEFVDAGDDPAAALEASKMPDFWQRSFSGGEFAEGNPTKWLADDTVMESLKQARDSHTSWLGPSSPASVPAGSALQPNLDAMLKTMGYRFVVESVRHAAGVQRGGSLNVSLSVNNKGVAPFYFDWPLELALANGSGEVVAKANAADVDIRNWLPGRSAATATLPIPSGLAAGTYTLLVSLLDPDTGIPGVKLAIEGGRSDGRYALDTVRVTGSGGAPAPIGGAIGGGDDGTPAAPADGVTVEPQLGERTGADGGVQSVYAIPDEALAKAAGGGAKTIRVPVRPDAAGAVRVALSGAALAQAAAAAPGAALVIDAGDAGCRLPLGAIKPETLAGQLGATLDGTTILIAIVRPQGAEAASMSAAAEAAGIALQGDAFTFEVSAEAQGRSVRAADLARGGAVGLMRLGGIAEAKGLTVAAYDPKAGRFVFAPARIARSGGDAAADVRANDSFIYQFAAESSKSFADTASHWAKAEIELLASRSLLGGVAPDRFEPSGTLTRAQFASMLARALGLAPEAAAMSAFSDVPASAWFAGDVGAAVEAGLVSGDGGGAFAPNAAVTREQMAAMLARALAYAGVAATAPAASGSAFADEAKIAPWAQEAARAVRDAGLMKGTAGGAFEPGRSATRAEAAVVLLRFLSASGWIDAPTN